MANQTNLAVKEVIGIVLLSFLLIFLSSLAWAVNPLPPDTLVINSNTTKNISSTTGYILNTSGGYITNISISATTQNFRWKAFVGRVTGKFTLDDASGSTIYDWTLASVSGEVFATRNNTNIAWASIQCANLTTIESENSAMSHTNWQDNITRTFNASSNGTHPEFFVGNVNISTNSCPALHTYVNDTSQNTKFAEVALFSQGTIVYSSLLENRINGFDNSTYDFQMIVPENGAPGFSGQTAYYMYVELT